MPQDEKMTEEDARHMLATVFYRLRDCGWIPAAELPKEYFGEPMQVLTPGSPYPRRGIAYGVRACLLDPDTTHDVPALFYRVELPREEPENPPI